MENKKEEEWWVVFWMFVWNIWLGRNRWVFDCKKIEFMEVVARAVNGALEYGMTQGGNRGLRRRSEEEIRWKPPEQDMLKLNTDAAVFKHIGIGLGGVIRDSAGEVQLATCRGLMGYDSAELAEALSVRHGLSEAVEAGFLNLIIETDCAKVFKYLNEGRCEATSFGRVITDILGAAQRCRIIKFSHVKRQGNKVSHILAHMCRANLEVKVWVVDFPLAIRSAVMDDKSFDQ